ncbi:MAG: CoA pyrophosphatase [Pseudomonadota bacterium]
MRLEINTAQHRTLTPVSVYCFDFLGRLPMRGDEIAQADISPIGRFQTISRQAMDFERLRQLLHATPVAQTRHDNRLAPKQTRDASTAEEVAYTPAAVLLPIIAHKRNPTVLFTRRTQQLKHHPGQISFPGGRVEANDGSSVHTALRETHEEIGIDPKLVKIIGYLPEHKTVTRFSITPVVGVIHPPLALNLDRFEVAEVFEVPLAVLLDRSRYQQDTHVDEGQIRQIDRIVYRGQVIWGATAAIVLSFCQLVENNRDSLQPV